MENLIKVREVRGEACGFCAEGFEGTFSARKLPPAPAWLIPFHLCPSYWPRNFHLGKNSANSWKWSSHKHIAFRQRNQMHESVKKQTNRQTKTCAVLTLIRTHRFRICHLLDSPAAVLGVYLPALVCSPSAEDAQVSVLGHSRQGSTWELKEHLGLQDKATEEMFSDTIRRPLCCDLR